MRLKVGDKVKVINDCGNSRVTNRIGILKKDDKSWKPYQVYFEDIDDFYWFLEDQLALVNKKITKQELFDMPIGTKIYTDTKDEDYQKWIKTSKEYFYNYESEVNLNEDDINNDLTLDFYDDDYGIKIIKIEEPTYETVYDYSTEVQEMTVAEIEKALGHAVKIIKEDN